MHNSINHIETKKIFFPAQSKKKHLFLFTTQAHGNMWKDQLSSTEICTTLCMMLHDVTRSAVFLISTLKTKTTP